MSPQNVALPTHPPSPAGSCNADSAVTDALKAVTGNCKVHVQPFPLVFHTCQPGSCVRRQIRLTNAGKGDETISVSPSNPFLIVSHKEKLTLAPGASVLLPVIIRVPQDFSDLRRAGRFPAPEGCPTEGDANFAMVEVKGLGWRLDLPVVLKQKGGSSSNDGERRAGRPRSREETDRAEGVPPGASSTSQAGLERSQGKEEISDDSCETASPSGRRRQTLAVPVERTSSAAKSPLKTDECRAHSRPVFSTRSSYLSSRPRAVDQHHQCTSLSFLRRQNCGNKPDTSRPQLATPVASRGSVVEEPAGCGSRSGSCSITSFLSKSFFASASAARRGSVEPRRKHTSPFLCASQNIEVRAELSHGLETKRRPRQLLWSSSTRLLPPERLSESNTTAAAGPQTEGDCQAGEAVLLGQPADRPSSENGRIQEAVLTESAEKRAASLAATNQLLREALQRSKEEIAALELLQNLQQETKHLQDNLTPRGSAASPSISTQILESREQDYREPGEERQQGESLLKEAKGARGEEPLQAEQKQRSHEQQGNQKEDQRKHDLEIDICGWLPAECIYPFRQLRAITGDVSTASGRDSSPTSKRIQEELHRSQVALEQQQQEAQRVREELRSLKATLTAASLQSEKQQLLLERKLKKAEADAGTAAAEAAAAKVREEQLTLQLEKLQRHLATVERSAAARSSQLSIQLQAAELREKKLKECLAEAQESLAFIKSLQREHACAIKGHSYGSMGRSGNEFLALDRQGRRSLSSCSFRTSSSVGEITSPQHQGKNDAGERVRSLLTSSNQVAVCRKLSDTMDSSNDSAAAPSAGADASFLVGLTQAGGEKQDEQPTTTLSYESPPEDLLSIASSFYREQTTDASSKARDASGDCCRSASCCQVRWTLQQRLCSANASLIVKTQLLAAEQAKAQELQLQVEDHAAASKAAEAAADGALKKLLSVMSRNASLQAKLALAAAASATHSQPGDGGTPIAVIENLRESHRRLQVQCTLLSKEKDVWKERLEQQLHKQYQLMEELHQQELLLVEARGDCGEKTHRRHQKQEELARDAMRQSSRGSRAAGGAAASVSANALCAAADLPPGSEPDPLLSALQQLVKGLQQLEKDVTFLRPSSEAADDALRLLSGSPGPTPEQQPLSKQLDGQQAALLVCRWPQDRGGPTENLNETIDVKNEMSIHRSATGLAQDLTEAGNNLMTQLCATLVELGLRLKDCRDEATKSKRETSMLRNLLQNERVTRCRVHFENGVLEAQLSALQIKLTVMESVAEVEAQQAAEGHKAQVAEISRQLRCALETLKEWERERPLLVSQQLALARKVSKLEAALRAALVRTRQEVKAAKKAAEDNVFQTLSGWRESLVKTTVEAAESCCDCNCSISRRSRCDINTGSEGPWRCWKRQEEARHVFRGLERRHASAELAILELTDALTNAYFRLACSAACITGHARDSDKTAHEGEEAEAKGKDNALKRGSSLLSEVVEELADLPCSLSKQQAKSPSPQLSPEKWGLPQQGSASIQRASHIVAARSCPYCEENSRRVLEQYRHQQQLFAAYSAQQQELQSTSGALSRALTEIAHLRDCLKALATQTHALGEAAAIGEAAAAQNATLQAQLDHFKDSLDRERRVRGREMSLLGETHRALLHQFIGAHHRETGEVLKAVQNEADAAKHKLHLHQVKAEQLEKLVVQLQDDLAEHAHTADHLLKALAAFGIPGRGGAEERSRQINGKGERPPDADAAHLLLTLLLECCARLSSLEREKVVKLTPSGLAKQLPPVDLRKRPVHSPDAEEALLAHRLLLGSLIKTQLGMLPCKPHRDGMALQRLPQKLHPLPSPSGLEVADAQASGSGSSSNGEMERRGEMPACCSSLAALVLSQLMEFRCGVSSPVSRDSPSSHCSKCTGRSLAALAAAGAAWGSASQRAFQAAEGRAIRLVQHIHSLGGLLSFVVAAQQRLFDLLDAKASTASTAPDGSNHASASAAAAQPVAGEQSESQPQVEGEAAEVWLLLKHFRSVASETADQLKAAHTLSISLTNELASVLGAAAGGAQDSTSSIVCNTSEGSASAQAGAPRTRILCRRQADQHAFPSTATTERSSRLLKRQPSASRGATPTSGVATANIAAAPIAGILTKAHTLKTTAVLSRSSKHAAHVASEAPFAMTQPTQKRSAPFPRRIRRCKSCDFKDPRRKVRTTLTQRSEGSQVKKGEEEFGICGNPNQNHHLHCAHLGGHQQANTSNGMQGGQQRMPKSAWPAEIASCCSCMTHSRPPEVGNPATDKGNDRQGKPPAYPSQPFVECLSLSTLPAELMPPFTAHRMRGEGLAVCTDSGTLRASAFRLQTQRQNTDGHAFIPQWKKHHCNQLPFSETSQLPEEPGGAQQQLQQQAHQQEQGSLGICKKPGTCICWVHETTDVRTVSNSMGPTRSGQSANDKPTVPMVLLTSTCLPTSSCCHQNQLAMRALGQTLSAAERPLWGGADGRHMGSFNCSGDEAAAVPQGRFQSQSNTLDYCSFGLHARRRVASSLMHFPSLHERLQAAQVSSYEDSLRRLRQNAALAAELNQLIS